MEVLLMKQLRIEKKWSQAGLAREAQMHPSTISLLESGMNRPYPIQMQKIAEALEWEGNPVDLFELVKD